jgi:hypothetical protein
MQELLTTGAITKDDLATAIDGCGISSEDSISFEKFGELLTVIEDFIDDSKLPQGDDEVEERKLVINADSDVDDVMQKVENIISEEGVTSVSYINSRGQRSEGQTALDSLVEDAEEIEESDDEVMDMVRLKY